MQECYCKVNEMPGNIEKPPILSDEQIETIIRRTFPLFELNEEDEEDRKETTLNLLAAQLDVAVTYYEPLIQQAKAEVAREIFEVYDRYVEALEYENGSLIGLTYTHGWRSSQFEFGKKCRADIQSLKSQYGGQK